MTLIPEAHDASDGPPRGLVETGPGGAGSVGIGLRVTPLALFGSARSRRLVERNILVYRRLWPMLVTGFFEPFFYLLSIGVGLNHLVGPLVVDGQLVPYTDFVAPGLLAAAAMNGAMFDATFNIFFKLKIAKTYDAILSTPLSVGDVALGELTWSLMRGALYSGAFLTSWPCWAMSARRGPCCASRAPCSSASPSLGRAWPAPPTCAAGRTSTCWL